MKRSVSIIGGLGLLLAVHAQGWQAPRPIIAHQSYHGPEGDIDLLGVCKVDPEEVVCWKPDGTPANDLADILRSYLKLNTGFTIAHGKKTRYAIIRNRRPSTAQVSFEGESFDLGDRSSWSRDLVDTTWVSARRIVSNRADRFGEVKGLIQRLGGTSDRLNLVTGAKVNYLGGTLRIEKILDHQLDRKTYLGQPLPRWQIHYEYKGPHGYWGDWVAYRRDGLPIWAVDRQGKPVLADPAVVGFDSPYDSSRAGQVPVRAKFTEETPGYPSGMRVGEGVVYTNIDPAHIGFVAFTGYFDQEIRITGIPLDPK